MPAKEDRLTGFSYWLENCREGGHADVKWRVKSRGPRGSLPGGFWLPDQVGSAETTVSWPSEVCCCWARRLRPGTALAAVAAEQPVARPLWARMSRGDPATRPAARLAPVRPVLLPAEQPAGGQDLGPYRTGPAGDVLDMRTEEPKEGGDR